MLICSIFIVYSCASNKKGEEKATDVSMANPSAASDSFKTIYLWGSQTAWPAGTYFPLDDVPIDHAFATDYNPITGACPIDSNYWYCLGGSHPSNSDSINIRTNCNYQHDTALLYHQGMGNVNFAVKLVWPNSINRNSCPDDFGNATGGLPWPYAAFGVCHQIANRAAYATYWKGPNTFGAPVTLPKNLPGYRLSHFIYGTYGINYATNFVPRIDSLGGNSSFVGDNGDSLEKAWMIEDFGQVFVDSFWTDIQIARLAIQLEVTELAYQKAPKCPANNMEAAKSASQFNQAVAKLLQRKLLPVMGKNANEKYTRMFGFPPGKERKLVDVSFFRN